MRMFLEGKMCHMNSIFNLHAQVSYIQLVRHFSAATMRTEQHVTEGAPRLIVIRRGAPSVTCCSVRIVAALKCRTSCIYVTWACKLNIEFIWHILPSKNMRMKRDCLLHTLIPPIAFALQSTVSLDLA